MNYDTIKYTLKYKKHILYSLYLIAFVAMVVTAYTGSKYRPESVSILFTDLSWLGNWPKWLDLPLMPYLNEGFDKLSNGEVVRQILMPNP